MLLFTLTLLSTSMVFADSIFDIGEDFIDDVKSFIIIVATPAAVIGIGIGALMQKISMGDEQKIRRGKSLVWTSIIAWTILNAAPRIFETIQSYLR